MGARKKSPFHFLKFYLSKNLTNQFYLDLAHVEISDLSYLHEIIWEKLNFCFLLQSKYFSFWRFIQNV